MTTFAPPDPIHSWVNLLGPLLFYGLGITAGMVATALTVFSRFRRTAGETPIRLFTLRPVTGFVFGFGWTGGLALSAGLGGLLATIMALCCGALVMAGVVLVLCISRGLPGEDSMAIADALHATGTICLTVPPERAAGGTVLVRFNGRQEVFSAVTASLRPLSSGEGIRVTGIVNTRTVLVEPL